MFKKIFSRDEDEDDEVFETVDPVLELRRKEKFSAPLIYNDEEDKQEEVVEKKETVVKTPVNFDNSYHMSEIISPMAGVMKTSKSSAVKVAKPKVKKVKKDNDDLVPIISPFYGPSIVDDKEDLIEEEVVLPKDDMFEDLSVESNLRNIAHIVAEEQDQLKIIEERTGEFKLDFNNTNEDSFIDEIDDSMSLDELMSLYENKFKD